VYELILIALVLTISLAVWNLVHASHRSITLFLPPKLTLYAGSFLIYFGFFA
jgi:hypothetical protein